MGPSSHLHAFRVQKRDEHSIQILHICYYMWCFSMSFGTTFGSKGPAGTLVKSTNAERWWDFSPRKSTVIKTSQQRKNINWKYLMHFTTSSCHHPHPSTLDARATAATAPTAIVVPRMPTVEPKLGAVGVAPVAPAATRGAAQATRGSSELQEDRCAHADHGAQRQPWNTSGRLESCWQIRGNWESWAKKLRPE